MSKPMPLIFSDWYENRCFTLLQIALSTSYHSPTIWSSRTAWTYHIWCLIQNDTISLQLPQIAQCMVRLMFLHFIRICFERYASKLINHFTIYFQSCQCCLYFYFLISIFIADFKGIEIKTCEWQKNLVSLNALDIHMKTFLTHQTFVITTETSISHQTCKDKRSYKVDYFMFQRVSKSPSFLSKSYLVTRWSKLPAIAKNLDLQHLYKTP